MFSSDGAVTKDGVRIQGYYYSGKVSNSIWKHVPDDFIYSAFETDMLILVINCYSTDDIQIFNASSLYMQAEVLSLLKMQIQIAPAMQLYLSMPPDAFPDTVGKSSK